MIEPRVWVRPDGTLVVRDPHGRYGADVTWLSADDPAPEGAVPLVAAPEVDTVPLNVLEGRARDVARALGDAVEDDDVPRWYDVMGRVRDLARRRDAATPVGREDTASPDRNELYERLAAIEHDRWASWQRYLHSKCTVQIASDRDPGSLVIPSGYVENLWRLIDTPYDQLTEQERSSDREQVDRYWHLVAPGPPSVDEIARTIDEALDADFESRMSGGGPVSREDMARDAAERIVELWPTPAQPTEAPDAQRAAPIRDALVGAFDDALFYTAPDGARVFRWTDERLDEVDEPLLANQAERMADVALGVLRAGGADGGGEDEEPPRTSKGRPITFQTDRRSGERFRHTTCGTVRVLARDLLPIVVDLYDEDIQVNADHARDLALTLLAAIELPALSEDEALALPYSLGEAVTGDRAVSAPVGTTLGAKSAAVAAVHTTGGWSVTGMNHEQDHEAQVRVNEWVVLALPEATS